MKQLTCEMCGSTELVKQDGYFICQFCGCKYSVEEAKKMMIEGTVDVQGTVKVDNTAFVEKYLANARRAKQKEDWEEVEKYYNMVEQNDPTNIEAIFYSSYGKAKRSLVESDYYKREAAFKVLQNSISVIDDNFDYQKADKEIRTIDEISNDIIAMACSSYVYNQTKNGYGVVTQTDKYQTITLFNNLGLAFTDSLDNIVSKFGENDKDKKIKLLKIALKHVEFILKNGSLRKPTQMINIAVAYHQQIHDLDPTHVAMTQRELMTLSLPESATSRGNGIAFSILMSLYCIFPVLGSIISGILFYRAHAGKMPNVNKKLAKVTLIINLIITVLLPIIIISTI